jgi:hypothetical protein
MKTKLLPLITIFTLFISINSSAQRMKLNEHIFAGSAGGFLRSALWGPSRSLYFAAQTDYQWRFSDRFSIGAVGSFGYYKMESQGISHIGAFVAPEGRFWFPTKSSRFSPFLFANYGLQTGFTNYNIGNATGVSGAGGAGLGIIGWINPRWGIQAKYNIVTVERDNVVLNPRPSNIQFGVVFKPGAKKNEDKKADKE